MSTQSNGCANNISSTKFTNVSVSESHYNNESHGFSISSSFSQGMKLSSETTSSTTLNTPGECSFIVQRVERLYGPGALAQGFYTRHKTNSEPQSEEKQQEEIIHSDVEESLPVLRLLRPEFRAQLSLAKRKSSCNILSPRNEERNGELKERIIPIEIENDNSDFIIEERKSVPVSSQKDGYFYLQLVDEEVKTLQKLAGEIESELEPPSSVPEEFAGRLRAAAGKARLLASQKLAQFQGLCKKNINRDMNEHFPTTCEDLAGFWDMVSIQINSVHEEFDKINALKASGWTKDPSTEITSKSNGAATSVCRARGSSKPNVSSGKIKSSSTGNKARDEERKRLIEERRKAMRKNLNQNTNDDKLFVFFE